MATNDHGNQRSGKKVQWYGNIYRISTNFIREPCRLLPRSYIMMHIRFDPGAS